MVDEPQRAGRGAADAGTDASEGLLAAAEGLAAQEAEDRPARARAGSVRRRQRVSRGRAADGSAILNVDDDAGEERVRVRSLADEPGTVGARPPVDPVAEAERQAAATAQAEADGVMLDAAGNPIAASGGRGERGSDAAVITTAVFLADSVRAYLDGLDELGVEHPVTVDRLASLRRTLDRFEAELDA